LKETRGCLPAVNRLLTNESTWVVGIDVEVHPVVLPLLSPLGRSVSVQVQVGPVDVGLLVEMPMTLWWFGIVRAICPEAHRKTAVALSMHSQKN